MQLVSFLANKLADIAVDMLEVNDGALWSINVIGAGFDCRVAERINRRPRFIGGPAAYLVAVAQEFVSFKPTELRLRVDGEHWEGQALLVAVCNAKSYGAGMRIAPQSEIDDGLLDVVVVEHMTRLQFARSFPKVLKGTHLDHPAVRVWRGEEVEVQTPKPSPVNVDGDLQTETPLRVRVSPGRGRLWMPG